MNTQELTSYLDELLFSKTGEHLDSLQIQNISDEVRYLDSIGRKQKAELQRDARIAEAKARKTSIIKDSENLRLTALRRIQKDLEIAKADAEKRVRDTQTKRGAMIAEDKFLVSDWGIKPTLA